MADEVGGAGEADAVVRRASELAWVDSEDRVVVVRLSEPAADPLVLADSAVAVWRAVGEGTPAVSEVVAAVASAYGVEVAVVEADVRAWLVEARRLGLVVL